MRKQEVVDSSDTVYDNEETKRIRKGSKEYSCNLVSR